MRIDDVTVEVRNADLERVGQILPVDLVGFEAVPRFNNVGTWRFNLPADHHLAEAVRTPGSGIVVTGPNGVLMSGPMKSVVVDRNSSDPAGTLTVEGTDDSILLGQRLAYPTPTTADVTAQTTAYDQRSGTASTVMLDYVNANIGPSAPVERKIDVLTLADDPNVGSTVYGTARFDVLGELLTGLASVDGLGFDIRQVGSDLEFSVYEPQDKSGTVRMDTANDTLSSSKFSYSSPGATVAIVAGAGEGTDRVFQQVTTAESIAAQAAWDKRIESFIDEQNTANVDELTQAGLERLAADGSTIVSLEVVPSSDTTMAYGVDWNLGDKVTVVVDDEELTAIVTSAAIRIEADGVYVGATVGNPEGIDYESRMNAKASRTAQRVNALERKENAPAPSPVSHRLYLTKNGVLSLTSGTQTDATGWTTAENTGGFSLSGNVITVTNAGLYNLTFLAGFTGNANGNRWANVVFSGGRTVRVAAGPSPGGVQIASALVSLNSVPIAAGETLTLTVRQNSGSTLDLLTAPDTYFAIQSA